jgi:hypothetical protein
MKSPSTRAPVGRAPAILDAGAQASFDYHSARHRIAQRARKAGQRLCRPLRAARDQQPVSAGEPARDLKRGADPVLRQRVAVAVSVAAQLDVTRHAISGVGAAAPRCGARRARRTVARRVGGQAFDLHPAPLELRDHGGVGAQTAVGADTQDEPLRKLLEHVARSSIASEWPSRRHQSGIVPRPRSLAEAPGYDAGRFARWSSAWTICSCSGAGSRHAAGGAGLRDCPTCS